MCMDVPWAQLLVLGLGGTHCVWESTSGPTLPVHQQAGHWDWTTRNPHQCAIQWGSNTLV